MPTRFVPMESNVSEYCNAIHEQKDIPFGALGYLVTVLYLLNRWEYVKSTVLGKAIRVGTSGLILCKESALILITSRREIAALRTSYIALICNRSTV